MSSVNQVNQGSSIQVPVGTEVKQPQAKSYLLNQPIKDTVSFSGTPETEEKKGGGALKWILGLGVAATGAFFTYRHFNPKTVEKAAENVVETVVKGAEKAETSLTNGLSDAQSALKKAEARQKEVINLNKFSNEPDTKALADAEKEVTDARAKVDSYKVKPENKAEVKATVSTEEITANLVNAKEEAKIAQAEYDKISPFYASKEEEIKSAQIRLNNANKEVSRLEQEIAAAPKAIVPETRAKVDLIKDAKDSVDSAKAKLKAVKPFYETKGAEIATAEKELEAAERKYAELQA